MTKPIDEALSRRAFVAGGLKTAAALSLLGLPALATARTPAAEVAQVEETLGSGPLRVLVVHGTKSGCTAEIASRVGRVLAGHGATVDVLPAVHAGPPDAYDAVVVGSGVRAGRWHTPAREWLERSAPALRARPTALFTCCLTVLKGPSKAGEVRGYTADLLARSGLRPLDVGSFAGWNLPERFSLGERMMLKMTGAPKGDFRDWPAIEAWATALAGPLGLPG